MINIIVFFILQLLIKKKKTTLLKSVESTTTTSYLHGVYRRGWSVERGARASGGPTIASERERELFEITRGAGSLSQTRQSSLPLCCDDAQSAALPLCFTQKIIFTQFKFRCQFSTWNYKKKKKKKTTTTTTCFIDYIVRLWRIKIINGASSFFFNQWKKLSFIIKKKSV